jgi:integrative and conjugative element protein (TIGR02256 family)
MSNNKGIIWLNHLAYIDILSETIKWMPKETGGILIGYKGINGQTVITKIVGPGTNAIHRLDSFIPDYNYHEKEIERIYYESNRQESYIGDWHTHPNSPAYLSEKDKITLKRIAKHKEARLEKPVMMILGTRPFQLKVWTLTQNRIFKKFSLNENLFYY